MPQYVLMLRDSGAFPENISAEEIQEILERYGAWAGKVGAKGQKLVDNEVLDFGTIEIRQIEF